MISLFDSAPTRATIRQLRADVESICFPKGRVVGSPGHEKARRVLAARLEEIGCEPYRDNSFELPYESGGQSFCNIIGVVPGRDRTLAPLLVGAHYDSALDAPSADDNAAAVAIALAAGQEASEAGKLKRDLIVAIFDAEEPPYFHSHGMGSERFYFDQMDKRSVHAALVMDLVGHDVSVHSSLASHLPAVGTLFSLLPGFRDSDIPVPLLAPLLFITGTESHPDLGPLLEKAGTAPGLKIAPTLNSYVGDMSDHKVFRQHNIPYFFLSCGRWAHYHQRTDTPDRLDYRKMELITRQVTQLLSGMDKKRLARTGKKPQICDTLELEIKSMKSAFGLYWPLLLKRAGLSQVSTRKDMDRFVQSIMRLGV